MVQKGSELCQANPKISHLGSESEVGQFIESRENFVFSSRLRGAQKRSFYRVKSSTEIEFSHLLPKTSFSICWALQFCSENNTVLVVQCWCRSVFLPPGGSDKHIMLLALPFMSTGQSLSHILVSRSGVKADLYLISLQDIYVKSLCFAGNMDAARETISVCQSALPLACLRQCWPSTPPYNPFSQVWLTRVN